ncbi:T9SS type A sorting domain-containing protein [Pontibacter liquoris]|uniref:T9SS type A sorting domain-containing protein n=1 Tax=Pontibacter liquoris TaxID=2905677 RepID=UPI001FA7A2E3|nr:T9SS type A sorting domain-containing protein [Pontibacter liquoris]
MKKILFFNAKLTMSFVFLLAFLFQGHPEAIAQKGTLPFRDDFDQDNLRKNWHAYNSWSVADGIALNQVQGTGGTLLTKAHFDAPSYVIETVAKGFTNSYWREFRLLFGQTSIKSDSAYVLSYTPNSGGRLTLGRATDNILYPEVLDEVAVHPDLEAGTWCKFKIARHKSGLIQVFLDNGHGYSPTPLLEAIDTTYPQLGHFGWREDTQTGSENFYVDWIGARLPFLDKPAIKEKPLSDDMITQVTASSGAAYKVAKLQTGVTMYTDRAYTITSVPANLKGASFVQTANDDKANAADAFLTMYLRKEAIVYIAYDPRGQQLPAWLAGWHKTGDTLGTTDPGSRYLEVYSKAVGYGQLYPEPFTLGGNLASPAAGAAMNYLVLAIEKPKTILLEAENALLSGAVVASNHQNYSGTGFVDFIHPTGDFIQWTATVDVPGAYTLGIRYTHNGEELSRPVSLTVDSAAVTTYPFGGTYSWENWATYNGPVIYLSKGTHTIRATAQGASGPNMDYLSLSYAAAAPPLPSVSDVLAVKTIRIPVGLQEKATMAYPNPFGESTTIAYELTEKMPVNLIVYNSQGQKVSVLVNEVQSIGKYNVTFKAGTLQNGLYIYQLKTGNKLQVGKLLKQ